MASISIMALRAANLATRWATSLSRVGSPTVRRVVAVAVGTTLLVASVGRGMTMVGGLASTGGGECRNSGGRWIKRPLEYLKAFGFGD